VPIPICPSCGQPASQRMSPNGLKSRCEPCGLWSAGNRPLRDEAGHRAVWDRKNARHGAHQAFDPLWREGLLDRDDAYQQLALELGIDAGKAHMGSMGVETARRVPAAVRSIKARLRPPTRSSAGTTPPPAAVPHGSARARRAAD